MKKYFAQLRPLERRLAVGVLVVLLLVLNWIFIWPHFSDWGKLRQHGDDQRKKLQLWQTTIAQSANYEVLVKKFAGQGEFVAPEDQSIDLTRTIVAQGAASGVNPSSYSPSRALTSDAFFVEQAVTINVAATDSQLVDFLYKLGSGASMVRVLDLELQPDSAKQHLNARITLVASYQKNATANNLKPATAKAK
jgi:Tfp pilus assembly protein PilO